MTSKEECTSGAAPLAGAVRPDEKTGAGGSAPAPVPAGDAVARWPATRYVGRMGDMTPPGESVLRVMFDGDNDVIVEVWGTGRAAAVEFCNGAGGGGGSMNTRAALIALMVAIEKDNAERPHKEDELAKRLNSDISREGQADSTGGKTT